ncbi:hypothetical protein [Acinetobacter baumannii]|uniref:hypothetical protein n=1 Tax=Acinetobacter baumannii TaxID=470 RepID=UPI003AF9FCE6
MDNYKIINTHTNEIIKALNDLGYVWTPKKFDEQDCLLKAHWILAKEKGEIAYSSGTHIDSPLVFTELTLPQLQDLVVLKRNDINDATHTCENDFKYICIDERWYLMTTDGWFHVSVNPKALKPIKKHLETATGRFDENGEHHLTFSNGTEEKDPALISGAEALRALADGKEVEYNWLNQKSSKWMLISEELKQFNLYEILSGTTEFGAIKFRLKPQTIKLELELPKPFEPEEGEKYWWINPNAKIGYEWDSNDLERTDFNRIEMGVWRTEDDIKQVVEQLRKIRGAS